MRHDSKNSESNINSLPTTAGPSTDLICLSHLRWDFVYQRPQHLLSRCAKERRVFFMEEPLFVDDAAVPMRLDISYRERDNVYVVVPHLSKELQGSELLDDAQREMIDQLLTEYDISAPILWYYTPMALAWTRHIKAQAVIYDCMDELSAFKGAPRALKDRESELFACADLVFTGGQSLYEAKRDLHRSVYAFPSSIDALHFAQARSISQDPADQAEIAHPRLGFCGVIDERLDIELLDGIAAARPDWQLVMVGPIVKIDPATLPRRANIHYLGGKSYQELPAYLAGWDVALLPFARNESTRFISPTKTPEYLAAGRPVVSTSIQDVVAPYGKLGLVQIADTVDDFVAAIEQARSENTPSRLRQVDAFLAQNSWDLTWRRMYELIEDVLMVQRIPFNAPARPPQVMIKTAAASSRVTTASSVLAAE